ncbi:MAG: hypothetical protein EOP00_11110 [Pedobacter sp.]|nr:MAG: hypothetical protein EOP00_11110 [Pedobacter sp.]
MSTIGLGTNNSGALSGYENSIIEVTGFGLFGNKAILAQDSSWYIGGQVITNPTDIEATLISSTGFIRSDRVLLDAFGEISIQPGIPALPGGKSLLRPYDRNYYVELSVLHNDNDSVVVTPSNQFTDEQKTALLALIYQNSVSTISLSTTTGERGISTALNVSYNIQTKDDVFTSASINQGIGSVLANINTGTKTVSGGFATQNKSFVLSLNYTRNGVATTETKTATYTTYVPQFAGVSTETDFANLAAIIAASLQKYVQATPAINKQSSPTAQYIWFVSTKNNAAILDQNNFSQSVGTWGDGVSEFYRKSLVITLADGTTETVYLYRSRQVKTLVNFTYKIS